MPNLSLNELKQIAKMRRIKGYKNMFQKRLLNALDESELTKSLNNAKIKNIKEDFNELRDRFLKPKIKEIRMSLYEIKNKNPSESELKEIEKSLFELEESLSKLKKYFDDDSISQLIEIITNQQKSKVLSMVITSNMKAMGIKTKIYQLKNILYDQTIFKRYNK